MIADYEYCAKINIYTSYSTGVCNTSGSEGEQVAFLAPTKVPLLTTLHKVWSYLEEYTYLPTSCTHFTTFSQYNCFALCFRKANKLFLTKRGVENFSLFVYRYFCCTNDAAKWAKSVFYVSRANCIQSEINIPLCGILLFSALLLVGG
jgi:hypothetical protein